LAAGRGRVAIQRESANSCLAASGYDAVLHLEHESPATEPAWHVLKDGKERGIVKLTQAAPAVMLER